MKKYCFSVDGISVAVFTDCGGISRDEILSSLNGGEIAAVLSDGRECDFSLECFDKNENEPREPAPVLAALSYLFLQVRGYPSMTMDISCGTRKYEIELGKNEAYNLSVNIGKCKILYTKTVKFNDEIEIGVNVVNSENPVAAVICEDAEVFDAERLELILESLRHSGIGAAIAVSYDGILRIRSSGDIPFYEAVRAAVCLLRCNGAKLPWDISCALVNARRHKFSLSQGEIIFHPEIKYIC